MPTVRTHAPVRHRLVGHPRTCAYAAAGALTRRSLIAGGLAVAAGLSACSAATPSGSAAPTTQPFTDSTGRTVQVPANPQRIVALHEYAIGQALLSVKASVVGMNIRGGDFDNSVAKRYDMSAIKPVGEILDYNLEAIAALQPDLIVALSWKGKPNVGKTEPAKLEALAPTVYLEQLVGVDAFMATIGTLAGRSAEVAKQKLDFESAFAKVKDELRSATTGMSFAFVGWFEPIFYVATGASNDPMMVLGQQLGMKIPPVTAKATQAKEPWTELSSERMDEAQTDLLLWSEDAGDPTGLPLWKKLPAVRAGQAVKVDNSPPAGSYASYQEVLPVLQRVLTGKRNTVVDESAWTA